jgi:hypothetical protein
VRKAIPVVATVFICLATLAASEDRICAASDVQFVAAPEKRVFNKAEPVTLRLAVTNRTQRTLWIVPHLYPFDYWVDEYSGGQWKQVGGMVPASRSRQNMPLGPRDKSEYTALKSGETYSTLFVVAPELLGRSKSGRFRIHVRAYAKDTGDENLRDLGCAIFTRRVQFSVK